MIENSNDKRLWRIIILIISASLITVAGFYLVKGLNLVNTYGFKNVLESYNQNAKIIYFIICFLQPIVLPLPEPVTIMGGSSVLGPEMGAMIGFSGTILGIMVMYFLAKFMGRSIVEKMVDKKLLDKFNKYIEKNETFIILALFILPILPDEVICMGSGLAKVNVYKFMGAAFVSKLITSISLSYSLELIKLDSRFIIVGVVAACALLLKKGKLQVR